MALPKQKIIPAVLVAASLIALISAGFFYFQSKFFENSSSGPASPNRGEPVVEINNHKFYVEIADDPGERSKGLGGRENLCDEGEKGGRGEKVEGEIKGEKGGEGERGESCGMFFLFDKPGYYSFWMKDMKFPLDFVWIVGDKIIDIDKNIPPDYPGILKSETLVDKVLEVNAGVCEKYKIETGDEIKIDLGLYKGE